MGRGHIESDMTLGGRLTPQKAPAPAECQRSQARTQAGYDCAATGAADRERTWAEAGEAGTVAGRAETPRVASMARDVRRGMAPCTYTGPSAAGLHARWTPVRGAWSRHLWDQARALSQLGKSSLPSPRRRAPARTGCR